ESEVGDRLPDRRQHHAGIGSRGHDGADDQSGNRRTGREPVRTAGRRQRDAHAEKHRRHAEPAPGPALLDVSEGPAGPAAGAPPPDRYSAASLLWPSRRDSSSTRSTAASATTVPGGNMALAPASFSAAKSCGGMTPPTTI